MGVPEIPDQVKRAPTLALRAFFAGIGKILLATDRPEARPAPSTGPKHAAPGRRATRIVAAPEAVERRRSLDETGNVRLLATEELSATADLADYVVIAPDGSGPGPEATIEPDMQPASAIPLATQPLTGNVPVGASLIIHELPLPGFETLSAAAIRGRLRSLDVDQLQALLVHEHKNARRPEIISMIERRIEKIESGE